MEYHVGPAPASRIEPDAKQQIHAAPAEGVRCVLDQPAAALEFPQRPLEAPQGRRAEASRQPMHGDTGVARIGTSGPRSPYMDLVARVTQTSGDDPGIGAHAAAVRRILTGYNLPDHAACR